MATSTRVLTVPSHLECTECETEQVIYRKQHETRKMNHVKHMWCYKCKDRTAHIEKRDQGFLPDWLRENLEEENK